MMVEGSGRLVKGGSGNNGDDGRGSLVVRSVYFDWLNEIQYVVK